VEHRRPADAAERPVPLLGRDSFTDRPSGFVSESDVDGNRHWRPLHGRHAHALRGQHRFGHDHRSGHV